MLNVEKAYPNEIPTLHDVSYVVNFDMPESYAMYKEAGQIVAHETGAVLSLCCPDDEASKLLTVQKKILKNFHRPDMLRCLPILWNEVTKVKGRVEEVLNTLSNKRVKDEKVLEFKKQVVTNKSLREYFKNNPSEKEILQNDIQKNSYSDKILFKNLDTLPFYCIPTEIMAITEVAARYCPAGSGFIVPEWVAKLG